MHLFEMVIPLILYCIDNFKDIGVKESVMVLLKAKSNSLMFLEVFLTK